MRTDRPRILCVDDEPKVLEGLENNLNWQYDVRIATSGDEAMEILQQEGPFEVVISDMRMPGMDGATFLANVYDEEPEISRILLTGHSNIEAAIAAVNNGKVFRFLTKPCGLDLLLPAVEDAVDQYRLVKSVAETSRELARRNAELQTLNEELAEASVTDSLTGLHNRRFVDQFIDTEIAMAERRAAESRDENEDRHEQNSPCHMFFMMIDLDGFKLINDTHGHHAGDRVLIGVKDRLLSCCRKSDTVVRWGGDEFMIIGHAEGESGIQSFAERVRQSIAEPAYDIGHDNMGRLSASIGVMACPLDSSGDAIGNWEQWVAIADQAAYVAKSNGRNAWVDIKATELLSADDLTQVGGDLDTLVNDGKVDIDSCGKGGIELGVARNRSRGLAR